MGEIANRYLMRVKQFTEEKAPAFCIYTAYTFSFDYEAKNPKPTATVILNYDYAFWDSNLAQAVWMECFESVEVTNSKLNVKPYRYEPL